MLGLIVSKQKNSVNNFEFREFLTGVSISSLFAQTYVHSLERTLGTQGY